eukprot:scaffold478_cov17-Prasinocladus_malaysianus.AAC.1
MTIPVVFVYPPSAESENPQAARPSLLIFARCVRGASYSESSNLRIVGSHYLYVRTSYVRCRKKARPVGSPYRRVQISSALLVHRLATTFQAEFLWPSACVLVVSIYVFVYHTAKKTTKSLLTVFDLIDEMFSCYSYTGVSDKNASSRVAVCRLGANAFDQMSGTIPT